MSTLYERLKILTMYFKDIEPNAKVELFKEGDRVIGYIAYHTKTIEEMNSVLAKAGEEDFTLPEQKEFLYIEAMEILKPYQDRGYGKKFFTEFKERKKGNYLLQFTDESEYFWERFHTQPVKGTHWWAFIPNTDQELEKQERVYAHAN